MNKLASLSAPGFWGSLGLGSSGVVQALVAGAKGAFLPFCSAMKSPFLTWAETGWWVCKLWVVNSMAQGLWGLGLSERSVLGSHLVPCSLVTQEQTTIKKGSNKVSQLFCSLCSTLIWDRGKNMPTMGNHQGEVALEMKINSEGFFMHTKYPEFSKGDTVASKRRQDNLLRGGKQCNRNSMSICLSIQKAAVSRCLDWTYIPKGESSIERNQDRIRKRWWRN